jgi:CBS-domain-containing membrane protein
MLSNLLEKLKGGGPPLPVHFNLAILKSGFGGFLAIAFVGWLAQIAGQPMILGSLGASCVMLFGFPDLPFSQPRNVLCGHLITAAIGLICLSVLGPSSWAMALALALSLIAMISLGLAHPPAGSNPIIIFLGQPGWGFLLFPTLAGVAGILLIAIIYNNLTRQSAYPKYW